MLNNKKWNDCKSSWSSSCEKCNSAISSCLRFWQLLLILNIKQELSKEKIVKTFCLSQKRSSRIMCAYLQSFYQQKTLLIKFYVRSKKFLLFVFILPSHTYLLSSNDNITKFYKSTTHTLSLLFFYLWMKFYCNKISPHSCHDE